MAEVPEVTQVLLLLSAFEAPPRGMKRMAVDQGATSRRARVTCGCGRRAGPAGEGQRSQRCPVRPGSRSDRALIRGNAERAREARAGRASLQRAVPTSWPTAV